MTFFLFTVIIWVTKKNANQKKGEFTIMGKFVKLNPTELKALRNIDPRLVSYNVEMTEVTGGTFWKAYTDAQVDGTEEFPVIKDWSNMGNLQQWYDPIDTTNPRLIKLAKELGSAWVRVSGTWANKTYYDFDGHTNGQVPEIKKPMG